jgi:hypothetical protein
VDLTVTISAVVVVVADLVDRLRPLDTVLCALALETGDAETELRGDFGFFDALAFALVPSTLFLFRVMAPKDELRVLCTRVFKLFLVLAVVLEVLHVAIVSLSQSESFAIVVPRWVGVCSCSSGST